MGKNLKGKECGKGICQRKDGKFSARYSAKNGARREKHFDTLPEARNWLADAQYEDKHDAYNPSSEMTVDAWFEFWITKRFCMHALRHTYATRAIERGIMPKVLQRLLGHSSIKTTMDRYVHVTDASLTNAVKQFEQCTIAS